MESEFKQEVLERPRGSLVWKWGSSESFWFLKAVILVILSVLGTSGRLPRRH